MIGRDMPEVLDIENHASEFPWSEDDFSTALRQLNIIGTVAEYDYQVVGFVVYELHKSRLQLINVAVHQDLQRQGIGRQIVEHIKNKPAVARRSLVMLDVRETNLTAQRFFRAMGFKAVSILRRLLPGHDRRRLLDAMPCSKSQDNFRSLHSFERGVTPIEAIGKVPVCETWKMLCQSLTGRGVCRQSRVEIIVRVQGLEPWTYGLKVRCSTD